MRKFVLFSLFGALILGFVFGGGQVAYEQPGPYAVTLVQ